MPEHPDQREIDRRGKGPAVIEFDDGLFVATENLLYTTAMKFVSTDNLPHTVKSDAIKRIVWFDTVEEAKHWAENAYRRE